LGKAFAVVDAVANAQPCFAGLNWASTTKRIWFDGPVQPKEQLKALIETALG
jgi:hypothetical protein